MSYLSMFEEPTQESLDAIQQEALERYELDCKRLEIMQDIPYDRLRELADAEREGRVRIIKDEDDRCLNCVYYLGVGECSASDGICGGTNFHCDWYERKPKPEAERAIAATEPKGDAET